MKGQISNWTQKADTVQHYFSLWLVNWLTDPDSKTVFFFSILIRHVFTYGMHLWEKRLDRFSQLCCIEFGLRCMEADWCSRVATQLNALRFISIILLYWGLCLIQIVDFINLIFEYQIASWSVVLTNTSNLIGTSNRI